MNRVYVLEQALTSARERFQLKFAKEAADGLRGSTASAPSRPARG